MPYEKCPDDVKDLVTQVRDKFHPHLRDHGVEVDCVFARAKRVKGFPVGPAVKLHGYACHAVVRIVGQKDRAMGRGDAEIVLDGDEWDTWSPEFRDALIDHELTHLEPKLKKKNGTLVRDDLDRPMLKMKLHDVQVGWFIQIAQRHGKASIEVQQAEDIAAKYGQLLFPWVAAADGTGKTGRQAKADAFLAGNDRNGGPVVDQVSQALEGSMDDLTKLAMTSSNPNAADLSLRMIKFRDQFRQFAGDKYSELVEIAKANIKRETTPEDKNYLSVALRLAQSALENDGNLRKQQAYIAAAVELSEAGKPSREVMKAVRNLIPKGGSVTLSTGGESVTLTGKDRDRISKSLATSR